MQNDRIENEEEQKKLEEYRNKGINVREKIGERLVTLMLER